MVSGLRRPLGQWVSNQRAEFSVAGRLQELRATRRPLGLWVRAEVEPLLEAWEAHKVTTLFLINKSKFGQLVLTLIFPANFN